MFKQLLPRTGQRWHEEARHLPTQYSIMNKLINDSSWNMVHTDFIYSLLNGSETPCLSGTLVYAPTCSGSAQFIVVVMMDESRCLKMIDILRFSYEMQGKQISSIHLQNHPTSRRSSDVCITFMVLILPADSSGLNREAALNLGSRPTIELPLSSCYFLTQAPGL